MPKSETQATDKLAISVSEAAVLLGVSRPTMYHILARSDCFAGFKVGTRTLVSVAALRDWVSSQTGGAAIV